jgi:diaminopimelate decarboxylase
LQASQKNEKPVAVYFTGAYCLEKDIILKRKIVLPRLPCIGDAVAFLNTAGYMMHFYETESHLLKKTTNLMADGNAPLQFSLDETEEEY